MPGLNMNNSYLQRKKSTEELHSFLIYIIFIVIIFLVLLFFIRNSASGTLLKEQVLAKQIALVIDISKPGTETSINKGEFLVSIEDKAVTVKSKTDAAGYSYGFFSENNVELEDKGGNLVIRVF